mgnify:CR=1 FL=1
MKKVYSSILPFVLIFQMILSTVTYVKADGIYIENSGFEEALTGWKANKEILYSANEEEKKSGNASLRIQVSEETKRNWNKISQVVNVTAGKTYVLSYYSKFISGKGVHHIGSTKHIYAVPETEWTRHTEVFTAQSDTVEIGFGNYYGETVEFYVDDIEIEEVTIPTESETIVNGDFENDIDNLGWTVDSTDYFGISETEKFAGNRSLRLKVETAQNKDYSTYRQNVNVIAGKEYQLRFYCKNAAGRTMVKVNYGKDSAGKTKTLQTTITNVGDWKLYTADFTAEMETISIFIQNYVGQYDNELYFDDFKLIRHEPQITGCDLFGYAVAGNTIKAETEAVDLYGDTIDEIQYQWQIKTSGGWSDIAGETTDQYTISKDDKDAYLRVAVTPVSIDKDKVKRTGDTVYSKEIAVLADGNNKIINISNSFNGKFIGSKSEADDASSRIMLAAENANRNINNAFMVGNIPYDIPLNGDKRGTKSTNGDISFGMGGSYYKKLNCLMTYTDAAADEQKAVIEFGDGSTKEITYNAGLLNDDSTSDAKNINIGAYVNGEKEDGYIYSYTFDVEDIKPIKSISFPNCEDKLIVFAITAENPDISDLKGIIDDKISNLSQPITLKDKEAITEIQKYIELYETLGGKKEDIENYELIANITIGIKEVTAVNSLYDFVIDITFTNHIKTDSVNRENVSIEGMDNDRYYIAPISDENGVRGIKVTVLNYFDYPEIKLNVSENILCDSEPHFSLGENRKFTYATAPLLKLTDENFTAKSGKIEFSARLLNESETDLPYYIVAAVYSEENEQLYTIEKSGTLLPGESKTESETITDAELPENVYTKTAVFNSKEGMRIIKGNTKKCVYEGEEEILFDPIAERFTVCGKTEAGKAGVPLSLMILNPDDSVQYADTVNTGTDGKYYFDVKLHKDGSNDFGAYKVMLGGYGYETPEKIAEIYIPDENEIKETIEKLNDAKGTEIEEYSRILNVNFELFDSADNDKLAGLIKGEAQIEKFDSDNLSETLKRLKKIAVVEAYNEGRADKLFDNKVLYTEEMELANPDANGAALWQAFSENTSDDGKHKTVNAMLNKNFDSVDGFNNEFLKQMMLNGIAYPKDGGIGYIAKLLTKENAKACGLNADIYFARSDKSAIDSKIAKKLYSSIAELEKAINVKEDNNPGGGHGGSTGSGKTNNVYVPADTKTDDPKTSTQQVMFSDVASDHWAYKAIYRLKELEIISGVSDDMFAPDKTITREQFVKLLCEAMKLSAADSSAHFSDVDENAWYAKYVNIAYANGIISGVGDGLFGVGRNIKRQELCTMIARAINAQTESGTQLQFSDSGDIAEYAKNSVAYLVHNGAVNGFSDNTFRPNDYCTRAQAAKIIYEVMNIAE